MDEINSGGAAGAAGRLAPVSERERIASLDVLRGLAILGIFLANMAFFGYTMWHVMDVSWLNDESRANQIAWSAVKMFVDGKFITLFSILFGVGMMMQLMRATRAGGNFTGTYIRRLIVLAIFGFVHALFIWFGDILLMYAVCGVALLLVQRLSSKAMLAWAGGLMALSLFMLLAMTALGIAMSQYESNAAAQPAAPIVQIETEPTGLELVQEPVESAEAASVDDDRMKRLWAHLNQAQFNPVHPAYAEAETVAYKEGPLAAAVTIRAITYAGFAVFMGIFSGFAFRIIAVFLLGAAMMKAGFFNADKRHWHWRCFIFGMILGLPLEFAVMAVYHMHDFETTPTVMVMQIVPWISNIILALGYVGGVCLLVHSGALRWLQLGLAAVGRMALTNYLMQSLIATYIFYWWGLGLFGELDKVTQLTIAVSVFVGQIIFSLLWLKLFRFGPMEWLWRTLAYGKMQPMMRSS